MANIDINRRAVIEAHVEACRDAVLTNAVELGRWLVRAKEEDIVPHGEWEDWVRMHAGMSERSAQRLMQAAREVPEGSPLERLGVAKIEALLALPAGEREAAAEEMDAANLSSRQVWREVRERAGKTPDKAEKLDPGEALRAAKAAKVEATAARAELDATRIELERARQTLAMERRQKAEPKIIEKVPEDYLEVKRKLAAAEKEADRLADELDRAKLGAAKSEDGSPAARILSAVGAFLAEAGQYPAMLRSNPGAMDRDDWDIVESRLRLVTEWVFEMREASGNA